MIAEKIKIPAIIIDNNPISLIKYAEEYPETWKAICECGGHEKMNEQEFQKQLKKYNRNIALLFLAQRLDDKNIRIKICSNCDNYQKAKRMCTNHSGKTFCKLLVKKRKENKKLNYAWQFNLLNNSPYIQQSKLLSEMSNSINLIDSQQPLKNLILDKVKTSYEGENALKRGAITNGEMESSPALIKGSPADKYSTAEKIKEGIIEVKIIKRIDKVINKMIDESFSRRYRFMIDGQELKKRIREEFG